MRSQSFRRVMEEFMSYDETKLRKEGKLGVYKPTQGKQNV